MKTLEGGNGKRRFTGRGKVEFMRSSSIQDSTVHQRPRPRAQGVQCASNWKIIFSGKDLGQKKLGVEGNFWKPAFPFGEKTVECKMQDVSVEKWICETHSVSYSVAHSL